MKSLANAEDKAEVIRRLATIGPASRARWGTMTVGQMICHLSDAFRVALGDKTVEPVKNRFNGTVMKWSGLWLPFPWPRGVPTVPECDAKIGGTPPAELERDKSELLGLLDRFTKPLNGLEQRMHPFFGKMTEKEWLRWGYLHCDHHLRQFSV